MPCDPKADPAGCASMEELRGLIDAIDAELVALLARRQACIDRAVEIKRGSGLPAAIPARVEDVVSKVRAHADGQGLDADLAEALWREMIARFIRREAVALGEDDGR